VVVPKGVLSWRYSAIRHQPKPRRVADSPTKHRPQISGLTGELSAALTRRSFVPRHDRGRVLTDVAVMLADGGEAVADIDVLRHQSPLLGPVASAPTVWRTLASLSPARLARVDKARARVRRHVWSQLPHGVPASRVADGDLGETVVLDVDATIVVAHSERGHCHID
jgi:hypothetical protein